MSEDHASLSVSLPLDSDGFLRRECPTCEREFKWLPSAGDETDPVPEGGYFCPYCASQAELDAWHTKAQIEVVEHIVAREVVAPAVEELERGFQDVGRQTGGLIETSFRMEVPDDPAPLTEADDMRRVDFSCHPKEPLKVLEDWLQAVHCLMCGQAVFEARIDELGCADAHVGGPRGPGSFNAPRNIERADLEGRVSTTGAPDPKPRMSAR